jgi:hypothetical protein
MFATQISVTMKANMGILDRALRIALAIVFTTLFFTETISGTWGIVLMVLAIVFALTSIVSFCPLYAPFGINTCSTKK